MSLALEQIDFTNYLVESDIIALYKKAKSEESQFKNEEIDTYDSRIKQINKWKNKLDNSQKIWKAIFGIFNSLDLFSYNAITIFAAVNFYFGLFGWWAYCLAGEGAIFTTLFSILVLDNIALGRYTPGHLSYDYRVHGIMSLIVSLIIKKQNIEIPNTTQEINIYDPEVIDTVSKYLLKFPIQEADNLISSIDESIRSTDNQISKIDQLVKNMKVRLTFDNNKDAISELTQNRIDMAQLCSQKLKDQLVIFKNQKNEVNNAIEPLKKMADRLNALSTVTNMINEINIMMNVVDDNKVLIAQNCAAIDSINAICNHTMSRINNIRRDLDCYVGAQLEIEKIS